MTTPERREAKVKSREMYAMRKKREGVRVNELKSQSSSELSLLYTSGTPCAELDHEIEYDPSARGFTALQGRSTSERPLKGAALPYTNSRGDHNAEHGEKKQKGREESSKIYQKQRSHAPSQAKKQKQSL